MPIQKNCEQCGTAFSVKPSHSAQRFCKLSCKIEHESEHGRPAAQVAPIDFACKVCNALFSMKPSQVAAYNKKWGKDPMYCSTKCGGIGRRLPEEAWNNVCIQCGNRMVIQRRPGGTINRGKHLCSTECRALFRRIAYQKKHADNAITSRLVKHGYVRLIIPGENGNPSRDVLEHRYVMEQHLGRSLRKEETVHHKNGNRGDNSIDNLELFSKNHGPGQRVADIIEFAIENLILYPEFAIAANFADRLKHISAAPL